MILWLKHQSSAWKFHFIPFKPIFEAWWASYSGLSLMHKLQMRFAPNMANNTSWADKDLFKNILVSFQEHISLSGDYLHTAFQESTPAQLGYTRKFSDIWPKSSCKCSKKVPIHYFVVFSSRERQEWLSNKKLWTSDVLPSFY